uniref:Uncharacterized protein n=1 Tax=Arundo donax TaxID=35708 RepID=A0A0A8ZTW4_ARUDO
MEANDVGEEGVSDGLGGVGVRQGDEMAVLAEAIHDGEDDRLALHLGQRLDEVDADVRPHSRRNRQWLQQTGRPEVVGLVLLTGDAGLHEILHQTTHGGKMKIPPEPVEGAADALMAVVVDRGQDLPQQRRRRGNVQAAVEGDHAVHQRPRSGAGASPDLIVDGDQGRISGLGVAEALDEVKAGRRNSHHIPFVIVATGEGVGDYVRGARPVLHREIEAQELADPMVLRDRGEALIEEVLQAVVVGLDDEAPPPEIRAPVPYRLDEADELALVGG